MFQDRRPSRCPPEANCSGKWHAHKTLVNELTTLKQSIRWLIKAKHLKSATPIELKLRKAESEPAYCYRSAEVSAMLKHCRTETTLNWLGDVITALACTGLRIAELASLRWTDIDFDSARIKLTGETGRAREPDRKRRKLKSGRSRSFPIVDHRPAIRASPRHSSLGPSTGLV
jgi:integrase